MMLVEASEILTASNLELVLILKFFDYMSTKHGLQKSNVARTYFMPLHVNPSHICKKGFKAYNHFTA